MPDFSHERVLGGVVAGVDEVGRGPLAGPVMAAAAVLPPDLPAQIAAMVDDSKRLSAARREAALAALIGAGADIAVAAASVAEIEEMNILRASLLAMRRAVARLRVWPDRVLVDGKIGPDLPIPCQCLVGGTRCRCPSRRRRLPRKWCATGRWSGWRGGIRAMAGSATRGMARRAIVRRLSVSAPPRITGVGSARY
ncbi:unnamed protein product [Acidocella sp. C78]|nr:unnamed protein product [Acidocella sp. C78]